MVGGGGGDGDGSGVQVWEDRHRQLVHAETDDSFIPTSVGNSSARRYLL